MKFESATWFYESWNFVRSGFWGLSSSMKLGPIHWSVHFHLYIYSSPMTGNKTDLICNHYSYSKPDYVELQSDLWFSTCNFADLNHWVAFIFVHFSHLIAFKKNDYLGGLTRFRWLKCSVILRFTMMQDILLNKHSVSVQTCRVHFFDAICILIVNR